MVEPRTLRSHPELRSHASFPLFKTLGEKPKTPLEKFLSLFADVRSGEGATVLLLTTTAFIVLALYLLLKPAREALILGESGARIKSYAAAGQAALLLLVIPLYGWLASRVSRLPLLTNTNLFFAFNLLLFFAFGTQGAREGVVFYIWLGIFNVFVVSQFWAFANDIYTEGQGRRLFPIIGVGSSLGAWLGARTAGELVKKHGFTPYQLMIVAATALLVVVGLVWYVNLRTRKTVEPQAAREAEVPLGDEGGFQLIFRDRYLFWIAMLILLLNIVNSSGEFILGDLVTAQAQHDIGAGDAFEAQRKAFIGGFYADYLSWVNLLGLLLQLFAVSRIMRHAGVRGALFFLPVISLVSYSIIAAAPIFALVRVLKIVENATDYSLMSTVKQALWLPTSREAKYKAKAAVDTFFMRFGDMAQAGIVYVGTAVGLGAQGFASVSVLLTAVWLWVAWQIRKEHRRRTL